MKRGMKQGNSPLEGTSGRNQLTDEAGYSGIVDLKAIEPLTQNDDRKIGKADWIGTDRAMGKETHSTVRIKDKAESDSFFSKGLVWGMF